MKQPVSIKTINALTLVEILFSAVIIAVLIIVLLKPLMPHHDNGIIFDTNSLAMTPITNAEEPSILTYTIPFDIDIETHREWALKLMDNGKGAEGYDFIRQTNGTCLVEWNTTFASPGLHVLQVELYMRFQKAVFGPKRIEIVTNLVQFDGGDTSFGGQACIRGTLRIPSADYKIEIYDETNNLLRTIVGHTDEGSFKEIWDLKTASGQVRDDSQFEAKVYITPTLGGTNSLATSNTVSATISYPFHLCRTGKNGIGAYQ
jgi:hypothetical protein